MLRSGCLRPGATPGLLQQPQRGHLRHRRCSLQATCSAMAEPAVVEMKAFTGEALGSEQLSLKVADPYTAAGLVHRTVVTHRQNARRGTASTLTRSEVRGGGKKPYAQKGTGNARIGSRRTPLRPGGGVSFGPKPKDWTVKVNKKERRLAVATALQSAADDMMVIADIKGCVLEPKTRTIQAALNTWGVPIGTHTLMIVDEITEALRLSSRNIPTLQLAEASGLNVYDILRADNIVIEATALAYMQDLHGSSL